MSIDDATLRTVLGLAMAGIQHPDRAPGCCDAIAELLGVVEPDGSVQQHREPHVHWAIWDHAKAEWTEAPEDEWPRARACVACDWDGTILSAAAHIRHRHPDRTDLAVVEDAVLVERVVAPANRRPRRPFTCQWCDGEWWSKAGYEDHFSSLAHHNPDHPYQVPVKQHV